jgi:hypothetical protein
MSRGALSDPSLIGSKIKTSDEKRGNPKTQVAQKQRPPIKRQPQNARGSKTKTSDEKRGNPKTQGAQKQIPLIKKEATPKHKRLKNKYPR